MTELFGKKKRTGLFVYCFLKLFYVPKNKENKENIKNMFSFQCVFVLKNIKERKKIQNSKNKKSFLSLVLSGFNRPASNPLIPLLSFKNPVSNDEII